MKIKCVIANILAMIALLTASAQSLRGEQMSEFNDVINTDLVKGKTNMCALRDSYGFLWIGTMTGLSCYDGNYNPVYSGLSSTVPDSEGINVSTLFEYGDDIWFGGSSGLYLFDRKENSINKFPHRTKYGVPISSTVLKIMEASDGQVWILTHGQGFFIYDASNGSLTQNSRHGSFLSDMVVGVNGCVYVINLNGELLCFTSDGQYINSQRIPGYYTGKNNINMVSVSDDLWIAIGSDLYCYDMRTLEITSHRRAAGNSIVNTLIAVNQMLYLGTDNGIVKFDTKTSKIAPTTDVDANYFRQLPSNSIKSLGLDKDNSLMVVTSNGGLSFVFWRSGEIWKTELPQSKMESRNMVNTFCSSYAGDRVWLGTDNGLYRYDIKDGRITRPVTDLNGIAITSVARDKENLWVGTRRHGLFKLNHSTQKVVEYTYDEDTPYVVISNDINQVFRSSTGEIFVLTDWGLCRYNREGDNFVTLRELDSYIAFVTMGEDKHGRLWVSTPNNLMMRESSDGEFNTFSSKTVVNSSVSTMYLDTDGIFWIVTRGNEVLYFDDEKGDFVNLESAPIRNSVVSFVQDDSEGNLWIGTTGGLFKLDDDLRSTFFSNIRSTNNVFARQGSFLLPDGKIMFGGTDCIWTFNPAMLKSESNSARAYVSSIRFPHNEDSDKELERLGLDVLLYTRDEIELPYSDNTFTLQLSTSRFGDMPSTGFEYKLEGVDKTWVHTQTPTVTYTDLRSGKYKFLLRPGYDNESKPLELVIKVLPPWYLSDWAYVSYCVILLLLIWVVTIVIRHKISLHYKKKLQEERRRNEFESYEAKMKFFVNLVHETRTPLTLINIPLEQMSERAEAGQYYSETDHRRLRSMRRNLDYLLSITNQLLDFRKAEHDSEVRLSVTSVNINKMIDEICHRFRLPLAEKGLEMRASIPEAPIIAAFDYGKIDRVLMNLVGNAMKYARSYVEVRLADCGDGNFAIKVVDDGHGIPPQEREHIFDTYYQINVNELSVALGTGLGLAYAKLIADAHNGSIDVADVEGGGTEFILTLPKILSADALAESVINNGEQGLQSSGDVERVAAYDSEILDVESVVIDDDMELPDEEVAVLLVDDNREMLETVAESLSNRYRVVTASDGVEALKCLRENDDIQLVITDYMMPNMDGVELTRNIKSDIETSHIPVIILTAKAGIESRLEGLVSGADVYLEKPFSIKLLKLQIANILHSRELYYERMRRSLLPVPMLVTAQDGAPSALEADEELEDSMFLNLVDAKFLETLNEHIRVNINDEEFSIDALVDKMNLSRSSFYRKIKALTGMTPVDYLKNFRLDYAARLLREGARVSEVALMAGFSSSSYFAKCFKAKFGMIPKEYAKSRQR